MAEKSTFLLEIRLRLKCPKSASTGRLRLYYAIFMALLSVVYWLWPPL